MHRVPGEARAPVYAYEAELAAWLRPQPEIPPASDAEPGPALPTPAATAARRPLPRRAILGVVATLIAGLAVVSVQGWRQAATDRRAADDRVDEVRRLARLQVIAVSDRLEKQPGTVRLRAAPAQEAAATLARVAAGGADAGLRRDAAEAWRRLAVVQNTTDRPSLRDRAAARVSLATALRLVAGDATPAGRHLRARILADAARQAAADGAGATAPAMLAAAEAAAAGAPPALRDELALAHAEIAAWAGEYPRTIALASRVTALAASDSEAGLRQLRGLDLVAEAQYYAGDKAAALAGYRAALVAASAGAARWPDEPRWRWAVQRQLWTLGSTLTDAERGREALPVLAAARDGWAAMARADRDDEAVTSWLRIAQLAHGQALAAAGRPGDAIAELSTALADRRAWLAREPRSAERQRALSVGLNNLADVLAAAGRRAEACALYAESSALGERMRRAGTQTELDSDSMVKLLAEAEARWCRPAAAA